MQDFNTKNIPPKKSLGQNFLINQGVLNKIVDATNLDTDDTVIEIGAGTGNLTEKIAEKAGRVVAIEKDSRLIEQLKNKFRDYNIKIVEGDALKIDMGELTSSSRSLASGRYKIIGNIPYYITANILRTIFEKWPKPEIIVLTIQKEVAQRIMAKPPHMNLLALSVQFYSSPTIIGYVSKGSFRPIPKVDSAIIKLVPKKYLPADKDIFFKLIKAGFAGKRKKLVNNLSKNFGMIKEGLIRISHRVDFKPDVRAENLTLEQWVKLTNYIKR